MAKKSSIGQWEVIFQGLEAFGTNPFLSRQRKLRVGILTRGQIWPVPVLAVAVILMDKWNGTASISGSQSPNFVYT